MALTERGSRAIATRRVLRADARQGAIDGTLSDEKTQLAAVIPLPGRVATGLAGGNKEAP